VLRNNAIIDQTPDTDFYVENPCGKKTKGANRRSLLYGESLQNAGDNELSLSKLFPYGLQDVFNYRTD